MKLDFLSDNLILIVPKNGKEKIIQEISKLPNFYSYKIVDDVELKHLLCFDYDINALDYLSKKYNLKLDIAKEYMDNLYFIENKDYKNERLNKLVNIKNDLLAKKLLITDQNFKKNIIDKKIIVYGFDAISKEFLLLLNKLNKPYEIINNSDNIKKIFNVYHFETLEDECDAVCYQISTLLKQNIDINKIKIANANSDYLFTLKRYFKMYNLAFENINDSFLYSLQCVNDFLEKLKDNYNFQEALDYFLEKYPNETDIYYQLLNLANSFVKLDLKSSISSFIYMLKNTKINVKKLQNCLSFINIDNYFVMDDEYIFVLSINQGIYPKSYKDEDFYNDNEKQIIGLDTSEDLNSLAKEKFKVMLNKSPNMILSYKDKTPFMSFSKSFVLNENGIDEKEFIYDRSLSFSIKNDKIKLAKMYDNIYKNMNNSYTILLNSNYSIDYKNYDHTFHLFDNDKIKNYIIKNHINLSYSSLNNYYNCSFKYYLNDLLKLTPDTSSISSGIGTLFHKVLELSYNDDFDFDHVYDEECQKINDEETLFYINKLKPLLNDIIKINAQKMSSCSLNKCLTEQEVKIDYNINNMPITFKGFIDKILYTNEDDKTYVAIIDYKTGEAELKLENIQFGLSMQLPIYLYFLKNYKKFTNVEVCGFYLQKLLPETLKYGECYEDVLNTNLLLQGYSNSSFSIISKFDLGFEHSNIVKSLKLNKENEFSKNSKILSSKQMDEIALQVEEKVKEAIKNISECQFPINPKVLNGKLISCEYCPFKECCFVTFNDYQYLNLKDNNVKDGDSNGN